MASVHHIPARLDLRRTPARIPVFGALAGALALGSAALFVQWRARKAEAENPPRGRFIEIDGVRLHYVERGAGEPIVLLHGNGALFRDFELSGLVADLAKRHRVVVFDRPGYGYSTRPRTRVWTPDAQAELLSKAFRQLGLKRPIVLGHSWGALVALALGLDYPPRVSRLVLLSGYYYPTPRADVLVMSPPALPLIGDLMRFTLSPLLSRLIWPGLTAKLFSPNPVPPSFEQFPIWMALRPGQLRASAAEAAMMIPAARRLSHRYRELIVPALIIAGEGDLQVTAAHHSARLHEDLTLSELKLIPDAGHMIHHVARSELVEAIEAFARPTRRVEPASQQNVPARLSPGDAEARHPLP
jgi:pimeloyl-ACP methyl ester carboxylesterase